MPPIMNTDSLHDNTPIANLFHNIQTLTEPYDDNMNSSLSKFLFSESNTVPRVPRVRLELGVWLQLPLPV